MDTNKPHVVNDAQVYQSVRGFVVEARRQVYASVNAAMVEAYWKIGQAISEACGGNERAAYGQHVLEYISERLTAEFGKGFTVRNLRNMRAFYVAFPKRHALRTELSWTHYRLLMRVADADVRQWYADEAAKAGWSSRQLERQISTLYHERLLASRDRESVAGEIEQSVPKPEYEQILKDPYVLEFLDLLKLQTRRLCTASILFHILIRWRLKIWLTGLPRLQMRCLISVSDCMKRRTSISRWRVLPDRSESSAALKCALYI